MSRTQTAAAPATPGLTEWLLIMTLGFLWGASFMGAKVALADFGPLVLAAGRIALAAAVLVAAIMATGRRLPGLRGGHDRRVWLFCLGMGVFSNALPFFLLNWAQQSVASAFAGMTMASVPLFVLPLAHLFVPGERIGPVKLVGFVTGFIGVLLLIGPRELLQLEAGGWTLTLARLACVGAASCYAIGSVVTRRAPPVDRLVFGAGALLCATVVIAPVALWLEDWPDTVSPMPALGFVYLGLGPTALATLILVRVIRTAGPSFLSLTNYVVPLWSIGLGTVFMGETLPPLFLAGFLLIMAGLAVSQWRVILRR
ncbi:MAG: DMT family transporter [Roseovarius sp.]|nr:DMT family transporter [Roseovarius sp.]